MGTGIPPKADNEVESEDSTSHNGTVRVLINATGEYAGAYVRSDFGTWDLHPQTHCKMVLQNLGHTKTAAESIMGGVVRKRWKRVCHPFGPEYPGNRQWNINAPQLAFLPSDTEEPQHPTWDALFINWGRGLDMAVQNNRWCAKWCQGQCALPHAVLRHNDSPPRAQAAVSLLLGRWRHRQVMVPTSRFSFSSLAA